MVVCRYRGAAEEVLGNPLGDGVGQGLRDVLLADHVGEPLRSIFAGNDLIAQ